MKLVLVVPAFPQRSETFIASKAAGLLGRGVDVHVVCGRSTPEQWASFSADHPVQLLRDRVHIAPRLNRSWPSVVDAASSVWALRSLQRSHLVRYLKAGRGGAARKAIQFFGDAPLLALQPDVVHFEFGALAPLRMGLREQLDTAITVSFRGYDVAYVGLNDPHHYSEVWENADGIHVLGQALWQRAVRRGAAPSRGHTVITPAVDLQALGDAPQLRKGSIGSPDKPLRIVSVGRLHWTKGYDYALEAVADLRRRGVHMEYRIAGDGDLLEAVAFWSHQLGLDDVVTLLGSTRHDDVLDHIRWADVVLHASTTEGFGNAVLEAQALGRPVVCSDAGGLAENVIDGATGLVVARRDPRAMADALEQLAANDTLRREFGESGRARVEKYFGFDRHLDAWERFYREALQSRSC